MKKRLSIQWSVLRRILERAGREAPNEVMGFLFRRHPGPLGLATHACVLPGEVSPGRAVAEPATIARAVTRFRSRGLVALGLWHSHGHEEAYHSTTDDQTVAHLLPAMAEMNTVRQRVGPGEPHVSSADTADLPLLDGTTLRHALLGPPLPGGVGRFRAAWKLSRTLFRARTGSPRAVQTGNRLMLEGRQVTILLELPEGATLESQVVDLAPVRRAEVFSLVVNSMGATHAEIMTVWDVDGRSNIQQKPCGVVLVDAPPIVVAQPKRMGAACHEEH